MANWEQVVANFANNIEEHYDALKLRLRQKLGIGPVHILPYLGHGTANSLYLKGRALADYDVVPAEDNDSVWENLLNMYRRFHTHEIPFARVQARFGDLVREVKANEEGIFSVQFDLETPLASDQIWHEVTLELVEYADQECARATGQVVVPPPDAQFGVISDLDDTVIKTDVLNLIKVARNTFLQNSRTRLPFPGVAEFYHALQKGTHPTYNPIYYVSNSPWNLYDLLVDFFEVRKIPLGPFFLTEMGLTEDHLIREEGFKHKLTQIKWLLNTHPALSFILIGDNTEQDPFIYLQAIKDFPKRILVVYIRDVGGKAEDVDYVKAVSEANEAGVPMLLVADTVSAAQHAVEHGYIDANSLPDIKQERAVDEREPDTVEKLLDAV